MRLLMAALVMGSAAASLGAQTTVTIDPGMSREQVVAKLGEPLSARTYDGHTYLLYKNGCEKTCGMNDLVVLDSGKVVDAVFRATGRHYSGTSSSPRMISQADAKRANGGGEPLAMPAGEPKAPPKAPAKAAAAPAKTTTAPATKTAAPPPPPAKKTDAAPANKTVTAPPKTTTTAPAKKADATATPKKPDSPPGKKPDSTKKPPAAPES